MDPGLPPSPGSRLTAVLQAGLVMAAAGFVYAPALTGTLLWDDRAEFSPPLGGFSRATLGRIWAGGIGNDYYPLKTTVQWVGAGLWGNATLGFHLTNVGLHLLSAFLLWSLLRKLGLRQAWFGALLWVVHPLAVESVAWLAELKNVLSLPPLLLAMRSYCDYDRDSRGRRLPLRALAWFGVALLCKSSVVMFPVVLLLFAWWRRRRIERADLVASAPFFGLSLLLGWVEVAYQHRAIGGARLEAAGSLARFAAAGLSAVFYLAKAVFPVDLAPIYPRWAVAPPSAVQFLPWLALGLAAAWLWRRRAGWGRHALLGFGFFFVTLLPVLGFVPMAYQRISWVGDQLAYLPLVGVVGLAAASLQAWPAWGSRRRGAVLLAVTAVIATAAIASRQDAGNFRSEQALWTSALRRNPEAWAARNNLGVTLAESGRWGEAVAQYREALRDRPGYADAHNNLGLALAQSGRPAEALAEYREALRLQPDYADAHRNLGHALAQSGRLPEAVTELEEAIRLQPDYAAAHNDLGLAWAKAGRQPEAMSEYREALRLAPGLAEAEYNLGSLLYAQGQAREAIEHLERALRLKPDYAEAHNNLGIVLTSAGLFAEAESHFEACLRLQPRLAEAHYNYGVALAAAHRPEDAIREFEAALRQRPDYAEAENNLAVALATTGRLAEAAFALRTAIRLRPHDAGAHENLGRLLQALGDRAGAEQEMREAAALRAIRP